MDVRTPDGGRLKFLHHLARPVALLPLLAVGAWTSLASRLPEPWSQRRALGEVTAIQDPGAWNVFDNEPAHVLARLMHWLTLQVPGSCVQYSAMANAVFAAVLVLCLAAALRRSLGLSPVGHSIALLASGLLVCSPAFAADWLHGERIGVLLVPTLLLTGLSVLHGEGRLWLRGSAALLCAAAAPFCHGNGQLVFLALLPSFVDAARRAGGTRTAAWVIACLIAGNVAAAISMSTAGRIALDGTGLLGRAWDAPFATFHSVLAATGAAWLDPLPLTSVDDLLLGAASWLAPLALWRFGDRSDGARRMAAPWWGCLWFGLLVPLWLLERHGTNATPALLRELGFGAFLLPVGVIGVGAARFGTNLLTLAAGALCVLGVQDWHRGLEALRLSIMRVEGEATAVLLPDVFPTERPASALPVRLVAEWRELQARNLVPTEEPKLTPPMLEDAAAAPQLGSCAGGEAKTVRGFVRSSVFGDPVQCVFVIARTGSAPATIMGRLQPAYGGQGRDVPWTIDLERELVEGTRVRALGWRPRHARLVALGPWFTLRAGVLVADP